jgi:hypothetical protein
MPQQQKETSQSGSLPHLHSPGLRLPNGESARQLTPKKTASSQSLERWLKERPKQEHWNAVARVGGQKWDTPSRRSGSEYVHCRI